MPRLHPIIFAVTLSLLTLTPYASAQEPQAKPTPDDAVRVPTEEVHLTLNVEGPYRGFTPKLRSDDFTIYEDGVAQTVASMRLIPAQVMVLVDSGAALSFAKDRHNTNLATQLIVNNLPDGTSFSVAQYSERVQPMVPWTEDRERAVLQLSDAIQTGRRSMLGDAVKYVLENFRSRPLGNRHLILLTDGIDGPAAIDSESALLRELATANIAVHILSLTTIEQEGAKDAVKTVRINIHRSKPRVQKEIFDEMINSLPIRAQQREFMRTQNEAQQIVIVDLDIERRKMLRNRRLEWEKGEVNLQKIADHTGGSIRTPADTTGLLSSSIDVARGIGSNYDVTYMPARTLSEAPEKARNVSVESRSDALKLKTRKTLSAPK